MSVRGTENFVYYTDKVLGAGSTGTVYFGRHKRKGDSCAIKIFAISQGSNTKMQVRENELEFMRKLQHKNIVSLVTIEKDSRTSEIAMVLELCTEGSLQKRLSEPEYVNGLPEEDFKEFIVQFADGLHYLRLYGIAHRDIKPGNILCTKTEDGRILYKITDFGSSRELFVHDKSKALYGTEEYLHPDVYRCIFIEKVPYGDEYEVRAELWSIGVTLYQVACGQLPFQALGGRNNRMKMYEIISRKGANVISGVQKENSQIQYSNTLPQTCVLSVGLQERITPLMRKLMEKDEQNHLKFDDFFPKIEELRSTILITVYCLASSSYVHVYVQPSGSLSDIQKIVERYTKISPNSQTYLFNGRRLNDIVKDSEPVAMYPKTCERNPLILLVFSINLESIEFKPPFPPGLPSLSSDRNLASDATWSRDACAAVYRLSHITRSLSSMQMFTRQGRKWLVEVLLIDHNNAKKQFGELKSNYSLVIKNVEIAGTNLDRWIDNVVITMQKELKNRKNAMQQVKDLCEKLARIEKNSQEKLNDLKAYVKRTDRLVVHIEEKVRNAEKITELTFEKAFSDCDAPRCPIKLVTYYTQARDTFEQFSKDKKRSLTYNEDQIHKYQRIKLEETLKLGLSVINQHCLPSISKLNDFFRIWFRDECSGPWNNISHLEVDLKKFHEECQKISNTMGKIKLDTENEVKSFVTQMNLTLPTVSVPLTSRTQETSGYCTEPGLATDKQMEVYSETATVVPNLKSTLEKLHASISQNKEATENIIVDLQESDVLLLRNEWRRGLANSRDIPGQNPDERAPGILQKDSVLKPENSWNPKWRSASPMYRCPTFSVLKDPGSRICLMRDTNLHQQSFSSLMIPAIQLSLIAMIAEGRFSFVYKAQHLNLGTVAYKKLPVQSVRRPEQLRMIGEVQTLSSLKHPNIVQLKGIVFEPANYGLVLEYMEYGNISEYLHTNEVEFTEKFQIILDIVSGMNYLHSQTPPVIHGDLKSENVLVSKCKTAKICDFGFAAWKQYSQRNSKTQDWMVRVSHVPPEHWIDPHRRKDEKFDVYGFGILMWEIHTQRQPFQGDSESIRAWVVNGYRPDMTDVAIVDTSENIKQLMVSCWQQDFRSRPMFTVVAEQLSQLPENQKKNVVTVPIEPGETRIFQSYENIDLKNCNPSDIIQGFKEVKNKCKELEDYIDPENGLLTALGNRDIIEDPEIGDLRKIFPYQELNGELNRRIAINSICKQFIEALCEDEQDHIAKFIVTAGCETNSDERLLPRELRKVIDDNRFCLKKLIDIEKQELLHKLVRAECITSQHRERVFRSKLEDKAYELLLIIQRRRYRDFFKFVECQKKNIASILKKGGVTEIKIEFQPKGDNKKTAAELMKQLKGYLDKDDDSVLGGDQKKLVIEFLVELAEKGICFIGACLETSALNSDLTMFFQGEEDDPFPVLKSSCESESLQDKLEKGFRSLLKIPDSGPSLVKMVTMGKHSRKHHVNKETEHNAERRSELCVSPSKDDGEHQLVGTEQMVDESSTYKRRQGISLKHNFKKTLETESGDVESLLHANAFEDRSYDVEEMPSFDQCESNMAEIQKKIRKLKQQYSQDELTTKCHQLKIYQTRDDDFEEVIRNFDNRETQPVLNKIKLIKDQWRTLDLWRILQLVNPSPKTNFSHEMESLRRDKTFSQPNADMTFRRSIVLCCIFEDLMKKLGWKVGDSTLDIEEDICDVVGKLILNVEEKDRSSMLDCMQSAIMNIQSNGNEQDGDKLRSLLITKKKYNGSNLACVLLEQMILDNKDNNISWMRIVCAQFIDLVVQLIIEPEYREIIRWNLQYLMELGSLWSVADIYNLIRNGMLLYRHRQVIFHRHLVRIRNFAVPPSVNACLGNDGVTFGSESILYCRDEDTWMGHNSSFVFHENKSFDEVINELKEDMVGQEKKCFISTLIENSQTKQENYRDDFKGGIEQELEHILNSEQKKDIDVLSSCLSVVSMACNELPWYFSKELSNKQLVDYCLLVASIREENEHSTKSEDLLRILAAEDCPVINAMVAATFALLGRTVDYVKLSCFEDFDEWQSFYTTLNLFASNNLDETCEGGICLKQSILYCCHEDKWKCSDNVAYAEEDKSLDLVLKELGREEELSMKTIIKNSLTQIDQYKDDSQSSFGQELEHFRKSEHHDDIDVFSSCLSVVSMALYIYKGYKCDIVIVDEVDSMLIDHGVQCTYLSHDVASIGMRHLDPILSLIWMNVNKLWTYQGDDGEDWCGMEPEAFLATLSRISKDIDPLQMLRLAEDDEKSGIKKGFTNEYCRENIEGRIRILNTLKASDLKSFFKFALTKLNFKFDVMPGLYQLSSHRIRIRGGKVDIVVCVNGLSLVLSKKDTMKDRLEKMITDAISYQNDNKLDLPIYLKEYGKNRLRHWIDNAREMELSREYIVRDGAIYPVDNKSTGVIETNKKWGDGLHQFLEMKHGLPLSPLSLITNFLSNIDFFDRYGSNIISVSGTLGNEAEKKFMMDTFSVRFAQIPPFTRRKIFELDGQILGNVGEWLEAVNRKVGSEVESQRAVLVICENIENAHAIYKGLSRKEAKLYTESVEYDGGRITKALKPGDLGFISENPKQNLVNCSLCDEDVSDQEGLKLQITSVNEDDDSVIFKDNDLGFISEYPEQQETVDTESLATDEKEISQQDDSDNVDSRAALADIKWSKVESTTTLDFVESTNIFRIDKVEMDKYLDKPLKEIGSGRFGTVFSGSFRDIKVAIKNQTAKDQFSNEKSLASLRNPYIVPVLRFSDDPEKLLLMFPLMDMDLADALNLNGSQKESKIILSCNEKLRILLHIIEGLKFLHTPKIFVRGPIIHGDVRPENILLDGMKNARLADAGLAVVIPEKNTHRSTADMGGALGYRDPYKLPDDDRNKTIRRVANDLFSFGIVALQILKQQRSYVTVRDDDDDCETAKTLWQHIRDTFHKIPDAETYCENPEFFDKKDWSNDDYDDDENIETIEKITKIALSCIGRIPGREATNIVAGKLKHILKSLLFPLFVCQNDNKNGKCINCFIDNAIVHGNFDQRCCQKPLFCRSCLNSSLNRPYCPLHGRYLYDSEYSCTFLISGQDDDSEAQNCFKTDVNKMYNVIKKFAYTGMKERNIHEFHLSENGDEQINKILEKLSEYKEKEPELLIFYYSGHGDKTDKRLIISEESGYGITPDVLREHFKQIKSKRLLVILDCCYAGQFKVLPENCDNDPKWEIQMNSANPKGTSKINPTDDSISSSKSTYESAFTKCFIAALEGNRDCPMSKVDCEHCIKYRDDVSADDCKSIIHVYDYITNHMIMVDRRYTPNIHSYLHTVHKDTKIAH